MTIKSEFCERFPGVLSDLLPSIKAGKGQSVRNYSSSPKKSEGLPQAFIQFPGERVSANRYPKKVLEKS